MLMLCVEWRASLLAGRNTGGRVPHEGMSVSARMLLLTFMCPGPPLAAPKLTPPNGLCFVRLNRGLRWGLVVALRCSGPTALIK